MARKTRDNATALAWAAYVESDKLRNPLLNQIVERWAAEDAEAVATAIAGSSLSDEEKAKLTLRIENLNKTEP